MNDPDSVLAHFIVFTGVITSDTGGLYYAIVIAVDRIVLDFSSIGGDGELFVVGLVIGIGFDGDDKVIRAGMAQSHQYH